MDLKIEGSWANYNNNYFYAQKIKNTHLLYNGEPALLVAYKSLLLTAATPIVTVARIAAYTFSAMLCRKPADRQAYLGKAWKTIKYAIPMELVALAGIINPLTCRHHYAMYEADINGHLRGNFIGLRNQHYQGIMDVIEEGGDMVPCGYRFDQGFYLAACFQPIVSANAHNCKRRLDKFS